MWQIVLPVKQIFVWNEITHFFHLDEDEVVIASKKFVIMNTNGETIFSTSPKQTSMTGKKMKLAGKQLSTIHIYFLHSYFDKKNWFVFIGQNLLVSDSSQIDLSDTHRYSKIRF